MKSETIEAKVAGGGLFDPSTLRLSQDFASIVGVRKAIVSIPVRKPSNQEFVRVHPDEDMRLETAVIYLKTEKEIYIVAPSLWAELQSDIVPMVLFTTMSRQGVLSLWPIRLPGSDGRIDTWNGSALEAAKMAMKHWVRVASNKSLAGYDVYQATGEFPDPEWPELSFQQILEVAFRDRLIQGLDHPVIRRLRGEI
jgi:hypothetical protein